MAKRTSVTGPPDFGQQIRDARKRAVMTLDALAIASGVSRSVLSEIERGRTNPTLATLWNIAQALDLDPAELLSASNFGATDEGTAELIAQAATPVIENAKAGYRLVILNDPKLVGKTELYRLHLNPGGVLDSRPHEKGAREQLTVLSGAVELHCGAQTMSIGAGDTARYAADVNHRISAAKGKAADVLLFVKFDK